MHLCSGYTRGDEIRLEGNVMSCYLKSQVDAKSTSSWTGQDFFSLTLCHCLLVNVLKKHIFHWPLLILSTFCAVSALYLFFLNFISYLASVFGFSDFMLQCNNSVTCFWNLCISWLCCHLVIVILPYFISICPLLLPSFLKIFLSFFASAALCFNVTVSMIGS